MASLRIDGPDWFSLRTTFIENEAQAPGSNKRDYVKLGQLANAHTSEAGLDHRMAAVAAETALGPV